MAPSSVLNSQEDFLTSPAPHIKATQLDFSKTDLPEYAGSYAAILDNVLSQEECDALLGVAEGSTTMGWERAMINMGGGQQMLALDVRNCGRIIYDSPDLVNKIWKRIEHLPEVKPILNLEDVPHITGSGPAKRRETWKLTRPNERMRFLKYTGGEYFAEHCDGSYVTPDGRERSYVTVHLYLNDSGLPDDYHSLSKADRRKARETAKIIGGATSFFSADMERRYDVLPKTGRVLLFQHRKLLHSGDDVLRGEKYTMRTDLMYAMVPSGEAVVTDDGQSVEASSSSDSEG